MFSLPLLDCDYLDGIGPGLLGALSIGEVGEIMCANICEWLQVLLNVLLSQKMGLLVWPLKITLDVSKATLVFSVE
jgi:hypothetical protein